jgi:hypothetical protein
MGRYERTNRSRHRFVGEDEGVFISSASENRQDLPNGQETKNDVAATAQPR